MVLLIVIVEVVKILTLTILMVIIWSIMLVVIAWYTMSKVMITIVEAWSSIIIVVLKTVQFVI